ncbi:hypothetical protein [Pseudomonas sp. MS15a(2019)]|uniref:hypothetical protein n=1 Tax=Pseudomonas sp. MS15a(2019) TaxID=2579938 RepID=UPI0015659637|nr:hypothetical protein [Pseudomonas sp. MS15a(2019)]NRH40644.1 hypothetical protein [Pseudomonas sp. MS15a(2019)]
MKMLKWIGSFWKFGLVAILSALAGAFIAAMFMPGMAAPSGWADVMTAMFTFFALIVAVSAFFTWKKSKIRDDGYEVAKAYVNSVVELHETMIAALSPLMRVMATPGTVVPSAKECGALVIGLNQAAGAMEAALKRMAMRKRELSFWGVKLTEEADLIHQEIHKQSFQFALVLIHFSDACNNAYVLGQRDEFPTIQMLTSRADTLITSLTKEFNKRQSVGMASLYVHC